MVKKKTEPFVNLSWNDLRQWAGSKIVSRGRDYQRQKLVSKLAVLDDGGLLAWVDGSRRYATQVTIDQDGLPESICTCPYGCDCKHGVAVVLEYLEQVKKDKRVPRAVKDDERLLLFDKDEWDGDVDDVEDDVEDEDEESTLTKKAKLGIAAWLDGKTKTQLIELIDDLANKYPKMGQELTDRNQLVSGNVKSIITRLKKDIRQISSESGWRNHWDDEGYTPDYSEIRSKLETLLNAGYPDDVLKLGKELIELGNRQIAESYEDWGTPEEIEACMPVIAKALDQSSMADADKMGWAVEVVLKDEYDVFNAFRAYLEQKHAKGDWNILADRLLEQLKKTESMGVKDLFYRNYFRDRLSGWIIYALEQADRKDEVIPLCEAEAQKTDSYLRLVNYLILEKRYEHAERWIQQGIQKTEKTWPGIASDLRNRLKEIRISQKDWVAAATMQTEEFVRYPSQETFLACEKANAKIKAWPKVREHLLAYLEKGELPWKQKGWPLAKSNQDKPDRLYRDTFPMIDVLVDIAILEKQPDRVLFWYDQQQKNKQHWLGIGDDKIAVAIQEHAPQRSIAIWKTIAEGLISQTKPSAYEQAVNYLRKAEKIAGREDKQAEWNQYLNNLKEKHARKQRFMEILGQFDSRPIINRK